MQPLVRPYEEQDTAALTELSLRAWAPVFESLEQTLGPAIFRRQHPDWREDQRQAVERLCASEETRIWVAEVDGEIVGFVGTGVFDPELAMGEISILAVDPDHQGSGIGTALTEFALDRLAEAGMRVAMVETGGDPGHAPARRTYEGAGFTLLPVARYFKNL
ncbi:MAG TPA: GNAT family N-acetyltransferase [Rubrobacter sp.]|nr:GNAT family N-acetyltransferase [Rubrobacter sp.]